MRVRKAVITAVGRGTRMFPATRTIQKEMLPLVDRDGIARPTVQIIAQSCVDAGIEEILIVVEKGGGGGFRSHFRPLDPDEARSFSGKEWAFAEADRIEALARRISYVEQPSPEGFGHAVLQAEPFAAGEQV
ncbi:MAG: sugar phosphate nucleotidyltransferase, partial [Armatimonadota bacterium]